MKVCLGQGTIPRCSGGNCLGGCVAAELHGTRSHLWALSFLCRSFKKRYWCPSCHPSSLPLCLQITVCNEVWEEDSTKDTFTQNIYYKRWATWWWCKMVAGHVAQVFVAWEFSFFFRTILLFSLCVLVTAAVSLLNQPALHPSFLKQVDFTFCL